jgi:hypothetical protein
MIHTGEDCEGLEGVQLDDYDHYLLDRLDEDVDITMSVEFPNNIKIEDADDIQKECCKLINAKRAERRHRAFEMNQRVGGNLYDSSTGDLCTIINTGRDARNVIIARQQECEEVEAYSPTHYLIPLDYLETTQKRKLEAGEQSTRRKKTLSSKERFEDALNRLCPWHLKSRNSTFECQTLRRALGKLRHSTKTTKKGDGIYPNNDLFINYWSSEGLLGISFV